MSLDQNVAHAVLAKTIHKALSLQLIGQSPLVLVISLGIWAVQTTKWLYIIFIFYILP